MVPDLAVPPTAPDPSVSVPEAHDLAAPAPAAIDNPAANMPAVPN